MIGKIYIICFLVFGINKDLPFFRLYLQPAQSIPSHEIVRSDEVMQFDQPQLVGARAEFDRGISDDDNNQLVNTMKDIQHRIELRRMMREYMTGKLKSPNYNIHPQSMDDFEPSYDDLNELGPMRKRIVPPRSVRAY